MFRELRFLYQRFLYPGASIILPYHCRDLLPGHRYMLCDVASASGGVASAYIIAQIAGVNPVHHIAVLQGIAGTAVVGEPSVDAVHPPGQASHIKLIEVVDTLYVCAVIHRSPAGLHMDPIFAAEPLEHIEHALTLRECHRGGGQDHAVSRHKGLFALVTLIPVV